MRGEEERVGSRETLREGFSLRQIMTTRAILPCRCVGTTVTIGRGSLYRRQAFWPLGCHGDATFLLVWESFSLMSADRVLRLPLCHLRPILLIDNAIISSLSLLRVPLGDRWAQTPQVNVFFIIAGLTATPGWSHGAPCALFLPAIIHRSGLHTRMVLQRPWSPKIFLPHAVFADVGRIACRFVP